MTSPVMPKSRVPRSAISAATTSSAPLPLPLPLANAASRVPNAAIRGLSSPGANCSAPLRSESMDPPQLPPR
eukprot:3673144-Alexandrium_andersonii.AAC.1